MVFANRIGTAARSGDQVLISWQAWYFVTRVKIGGSLARNARFQVCLCILACLWMRRNYGGSCNALHVRMCQSVKIGGSTYGRSCNALRLRMCQSLKIRGSLARNARFDACMCVESSF